MPTHQALDIRGRGPTGTVIMTVDEQGMRDGTNRFFSGYEHLTYALLAASVDSFIWTCLEGVWQIAAVSEAHTVVGGSGATVQVVVCPQSVAIASGVAQLTAALDLTVTAPAKQFGTMIASPTEITRGDSIGIDMSGTLTGLVGVASIQIFRKR